MCRAGMLVLKKETRTGGGCPMAKSGKSSGKLRLYMLAKEVGVGSKELMERLEREKGITFSNHLCCVDDEVAAIVRSMYSPAGAGAGAPSASAGKERKKKEPKRKKEKKAAAEAPSAAKRDKAGKKRKAGPAGARAASAPSGGEPASEAEPPMPEAVDPELARELKKEEELIELEETVQRKFSKEEPVPARRKIVRIEDRSSFMRRFPPRGGGGRRRPGGGGGRKARYKREKMARKAAREQEEEQRRELESRTIRIGDAVTVSELASYMGVSAVELVKKLVMMGVMASVNQRIDKDTASILAEEYGFTIADADGTSELFTPAEPDPEKMEPRPPVVTVMGHVDHGKTSLLDAIRSTRVAAHEVGGITQHIGAYQVTLEDGRRITFLDTPGHEAFTAMRAHGAQVTDIAVLVVAADDGVKPQTVEAIHHAKAAEVPIIVAINKIDKEGVNIDRVYQELARYELIPEEWGGDTIFVKVSAKERINIDELLEMILLQAEMMELKADPTIPARGVVIESKLDKGRGPLGTVLVKQGTLRVGDVFVAGDTVMGRVRAMTDEQGRRLDEAGPASPVEVMGFDDLPEVADSFHVVEDEALARKLVEQGRQRKRKMSFRGARKPSLEELFAQVQKGETKELKVLLKGDTQGSVMALHDALEKLSNEDGTRVNVIYSAVGPISETDVMFASASDAVIVGFHVRPPASVLRIAQQEGVEIRLYSIIYQAIEEIEAALKGMLEPEEREFVLGHAEVREVFNVPRAGRVAGCFVTDGKVTRGASARLVRDGIEKYDGRIASLRRFKDDVREVQEGYECGIGLENYQDIQVGDVIEVYEVRKVERS